MLAAPDAPSLSRARTRALALSPGCSLLLTQLGKEAAHLLSLFIASLRNDSGTQFTCFTVQKYKY